MVFPSERATFRVLLEGVQTGKKAIVPPFGLLQRTMLGPPTGVATKVVERWLGEND